MVDSKIDIDSRSEQLLARIRSSMQTKTDKELQKRLAKLINLVPDFCLNSAMDLLKQAEVAADALLVVPPNFIVADSIIKDISTRISNRRSLLRRMQNGSPQDQVVLGLGALFYLGFPLFMAIAPWFQTITVLGFDIATLSLVVLFAAFGSIVSILMRIHDYSHERGTNGSTFFYKGLFKPIVGVGFALFAFSAINSGVFPITVNPDREKFFFSAISFLVGFSERLGKDLAESTEKTIIH